MDALQNYNMDLLRNACAVPMGLGIPRDILDEIAGS